MKDLHRQAKELRMKLKGTPVKKTYRGVSRMAYKSGSLPSPYSSTVSGAMSGLRRPKTLKKEVIFYRNTKEAPQKGERGDAGFSPVKGVHYFTSDEIESLKKEIATSLNIPEPVEVNEDFVKKIIAVMHTLPEKDKLEVSKGIRNAQSFIFGKTKYDISEMMHGGSTSSGGILAATGTVNGTNTVFVFVSEPSQVVVDGVPKQKTQSDGTVNWTGTTTITLSVAPNYDIYGIS